MKQKWGNGGNAGAAEAGRNRNREIGVAREQQRPVRKPKSGNRGSAGSRNGEIGITREQQKPGRAASRFRSN